MEKDDVSLGEMDIWAQNKREISRALRSHWCTDVSTYTGDNVLDVLKEHFHIPFFQIQLSCEFVGLYLTVFSNEACNMEKSCCIRSNVSEYLHLFGNELPEKL